jgi:hypothetical protein
MKAFPLALIVISISIICILNIGLVSALNEDEISISPTWKTMAPYQGESTYVKLTLTSSSAEQLRIFRVGLHFDWMASGSFFTLDLTDDPVVFPSQGLHIFDSLVIQIPPNASIGSHSYFIGIDGAEAPYYESFSWDSPSFTLQIQESASSTFYELKAQVYNNITKAVNAAYQSAEAQSLLDQANTEYAHAIELEYESKWSEALLALQNASSYLEQAEVAEKRSFGIDQQTLLLIVAVAAIVVVVIIVVVMRRRRKKTDATADVVDQSLETIEEQG